MGNDQWSFACQHIKTLFPQAMILQKTVYSGNPGLFVIEVNGSKIFSSDQSGSVDQNLKLLLFKIREILGVQAQDLEID